MKKFLYILAVVVATSMTFTACTEEAIEPQKENGTGSGSSGNDPIKP